jgi:hypothetical protein
MEFVAGLVLGSILGVVADRAWARFEQRIQISIEPTFFVDAEDGEGIALKITNLGPSDLPDYELGLKFPYMGQMFFDFGSADGPQGPAEQREHKLSTNTQMRFKHMFVSRGGAIVERVLAGEQRPYGLVFRLVMKRGEKVLFENSQIGDALFEAFVATTYQGKQGEMDWESLWYKSPSAWLMCKSYLASLGPIVFPADWPSAQK